MRAIRQALLRGCESSVMDCIHGIPKQDICIMCIMHTYVYASCVCIYMHTYVYICIRMHMHHVYMCINAYVPMFLQNIVEILLIIFPDFFP